jgi:hypothetical protein
MSRQLEEQVRTWLRAEQSGQDDVAERALARALKELGRRAPRAGFADRVMLRAGRLSAAPRAWRSWWVRAAVSACLLSAGLAAATLPVWLLAANPITRAVGSPLVAAAWHWVSRSLSASLASFAVIADVTAALQASLATSTAIGLLSATVLLASASLFGLRRLLSAPEESMPW